MPNSIEKIKANRQQKKVLVIGASGYVGANLVPILVKDGFRVRATSRNIKRLERRHWHSVELVVCDLLEPDSLYRALDGIEQVIYLVHSMTEGGSYADRDHIAALNFAIAAKKYGVNHIVYLGSLTATETHSTHLLSRQQTGEALRSTGIPVTELRTSIVIGSGSIPYEVIRDVVNQLPIMLLPKQFLSTSAPIALDNLLVYISAALTFKDNQGETLDISGPETLSYLSFMQAYGDVVDRKFKALLLPMIRIGYFRFFIPLFSTAPSEVVKALLGGINHNIESEPEKIRAYVPQKLLTVKQAIRSAQMSEETRQDTLDWYEGNMIFRVHDSRNCYYGERIIVSHSLDAEPQYIWKVLSTIGGKNGYLFFDIIWRMRGWIDSLCGGPGLIRYRENETELFSGEQIDTWLIKEAVKNRKLLLQFQMRSPGGGCLEFLIEPISTHDIKTSSTCNKALIKTKLTITAYWHPRGIWGRLYWVLFKPAHLFLFHGMSRKILRMARNLGKKQ